MNVYKLKKSRIPKIILWDTYNQRNQRKEMDVRDFFYDCRYSVENSRPLSILVLKKCDYLRGCMTLKLSRTPRIKLPYLSRRTTIPTFKQFSFADGKYKNEYFKTNIIYSN